MQQTRVDDVDLHIIRLLARNSRGPYKNIASAVGGNTQCCKRINKMISNGIIQMFVVIINPNNILGMKNYVF